MTYKQGEANNPKGIQGERAPNAEVEARREVIRRLIARGISKPGQILKQKQITPYYERYKNPYDSLRKDIRAVKKENAKLIRTGTVDEALGEYQTRTEELLIQCWIDFPSCNGTAKIGMANTIHQLSKDLARLKGIDPDKLDPAMLIDANVNISGKIDHEHEISTETRKEVADLIALREGAGGSEDSKPA